jgi:ABC-type uncharacterized transport system substrate-binding protein
MPHSPCSACSAQALLVGGDAFLLDRRDQIVALAERHALPAVYPLRQFTAAGGLMSYGTSMQDAYRHAGLYVGRILKGETPAELPKGVKRAPMRLGGSEALLTT